MRIYLDENRAKQLGREMAIHTPQGEVGAEIVHEARDAHFDLIIAGMPEQWPEANGRRTTGWVNYVLEHAHCPVFIAAPPAIPMEVDEDEATGASKPAH